MTLSLAARADHWGDRTAVVDISAARRDAPERYSYADLDGLATGFEAALAERGVAAGDTIAVLSRNRVRTLGILFACRRLGTTFAPVSHRLTPATVGEPVDRLEPTLVVAEDAQGDLLEALPEGTKTATFDEFDVGTDRDPSVERADRDPDRESPLVSVPVVDEPATEGGFDGIVDFPASALEATCRSVATTWGLGRADRLPLTLALSAPDGLLRVALPALYAGGTLLLDRAFDPADLATVLEDERVTLLAGRTPELRGLAEEGLPDSEWLSEVEVVADAGVPADLREGYRERGIAVRRAYGTPVCPTVLSGPAAGGGRPLFDCRVRLVADGEDTGAGSLEVAGPTVGAWRDGSGADERRREDGWNRTGDRFRRDDDGRYYPIDRD